MQSRVHKSNAFLLRRALWVAMVVLLATANFPGCGSSDSGADSDASSDAATADITVSDAADASTTTDLAAQSDQLDLVAPADLHTPADQLTASDVLVPSDSTADAVSIADTHAGDLLDGLGDLLTEDAETTPPPKLFDLTFEGTGYAPHDGQDVWFALYDVAAPGTAVFMIKTKTDGSGNLNEGFANKLEEGHSYVLYWAADLNGDGSCTPPPSDHGWSKSIPSVSQSVVISEVHNIQFDPNVCNFIK